MDINGFLKRRMCHVHVLIPNVGAYIGIDLERRRWSKCLFVNVGVEKNVEEK